LRASGLAAVVAALALAPSALASHGPSEESSTTSVDRGQVTLWHFAYRSHTGAARGVWVVLPRWYGPNANPLLKLVISPHGRGLDGRANANLWGGLPGRGNFALVSPDGQGRRLGGYSWGSPGQISDLARMPAIARAGIPWLRIDPRRVYAFGGSMGGQETLLLVARYPQLLAGAVAFDAPADIALRYEQFSRLGDGAFLRMLMRTEAGGTPDWNPDAYAERSPLHFARAIAGAGVPLQIWWSTRDQLVVDQQLHSGRLYSTIKQLNANAPVAQVVGTWAHTAEMRWDRRLPDALRFLRLLPASS